MLFRPGYLPGSLCLMSGRDAEYNLQVRRTLQLAMNAIGVGKYGWGSARSADGKMTFYKSHAPNYDDPVKGDVIIAIKNEDIEWLGTKVD